MERLERKKFQENKLFYKNKSNVPMPATGKIQAEEIASRNNWFLSPHPLTKKEKFQQSTTSCLHSTSMTHKPGLLHDDIAFNMCKAVIRHSSIPKSKKVVRKQTKVEV